MKTLFFVALLILVFTGCGTPPGAAITSSLVPITSSLVPTTSSLVPTTAIKTASKIPSMTIEELYKLVQEGYNFITMDTLATAVYATVDARLQNAWNLAHIPSAIPIPPNEYNTASGESSIQSSLQTLPKDKLIVFYDDKLDLAPALARHFLDLNESLKWGYNPANVRILTEGFPKWRELHYPTKSAEQ